VINPDCAERNAQIPHYNDEPAQRHHDLPADVRAGPRIVGSAPASVSEGVGGGVLGSRVHLGRAPHLLVAAWRRAAGERV